VKNLEVKSQVRDLLDRTFCIPAEPAAERHKLIPLYWSHWGIVDRIN
jgi:ribulose bisphosphate carboxylase small subunit